MNSDSVQRLSDAQRRGLASTSGYLLRSASSLTATSNGGLAPQLRIVINSGLPFSMNEGSLWAGRGVNTLVSGGFQTHSDRVRLVLAPEIAISSNRWWQVRDSTHFPPPVIPSDRRGGGYVFPWYSGPYSIDLPLRFGNSNLTRVSFGQSSLTVRARGVLFGAATENEWWGPGVKNALLLSNNAPGFPHLLIRSAKPLRTRVGDVEFRWLTGALTESAYFDLDQTNNLRSIAAIGATLRPSRAPGLTVGAARSVYSTARAASQIPFRWFDVLKNTGHPSDRALGDSTLIPGGSDQIMSVFFRWVLPESGVETYAELARTELPRSLREFLIAPTHTQGYTLGLQWLGGGFSPGGSVRFQGEVTTLEQSSTFRDMPVGSFYTSRRVIQGYTNAGQTLGAAIGPGSSGEWVAWDYLVPNWTGGVYAGRIRWNEDMRSVYNWPKYQEFCNHDVSIFVGARTSRQSRFGYVSADLNLANRVNAFFQVQSGCPSGPSQRDIRNKTLAVTFTPFRRSR